MMATPQRKISLLLLASLLALGLALSAGAQDGARSPQRVARRAPAQAPPVSAWPEKSKRWAVIVGVNRYSDERFNPLRYAANDATALYNALVEHAGFPKDQIVLLTTDQTEDLQPNRINIITKLAELEGRLPEDGLLLFAFSGHSVERAGRVFLFPSDGKLSDKASLLEESALGVEKLKNYIKDTNAGQVVMLLDSCRNAPYAVKGEGGGEAMSSNFSQSFNFEGRNQGIKAFATFMATNVGQFAFESPQKKQGFFTWAFVEGLKGAAANERGEVTLAGLKSYVQATVIELVRKEFRSEVQQPDAFFQGYKSEELVIAVAPPRARGATAAEPAAADGLAAKNAQGITDGNFWLLIKESNNPRDYTLYLTAFPTGQFADIAKNKLAALQPTAPAAAAETAPLPTPTPAATSAPPGVLKGFYRQSHALVFGVSDYRNGLPDLPSVRDDVRAVSAVLERHAFRVVTLLDPTRGEFDKVMGGFIDKQGANPDDRLLVYFAGHGVTLPDPFVVEKGFIALADTPVPDQYDRSKFMASAVSMDEIETYARRIQAKHAMFVFDSSFGGTGALLGLTRGVTARGPVSYAALAPELGLRELTARIPPDILNRVRQPVRLFLTAGGADQVVPDQSVFRAQFVEGLNGGADINRDGYITGSELGVFVQDKVTQLTAGRQTPQWGKLSESLSSARPKPKPRANSNPSFDTGDLVFVLGQTR